MSPEIRELREQQARIMTNARAKFDEIKDDTPEARAAEIEREFDAMMADHDKIGAKIERLERLARAEAGLEEVDTTRRPNGQEGRAAGGDNGNALSYRDAFHEYLRSHLAGGYLRPEARAVLQAGFQPVEARAQTTSNAAGGYTVPTEIAAILVRSMAMWGPMYDPGITTELMTTGGGQIEIPTVDDTASTAGTHTEGATLTDDGGKDVTFGQKLLNAYEFDTEWVRISKALADDSIFVLEQVIGDLLGERLGRLANTYLTTGSGSGQPNGVVTASTLGKTSASATAITADEIIDLVHSVNPAYRMSPKVGFMFNDNTLAYLRKLKDGDGNYLWQMGDVQKGIPGTLLGYRYSINQAMGSIPGSASATRVAVFGDLGKYMVRKVGQPLIGAIGDKDFWPGFGMAGYIRFDGELTDTAAVKHLITAAS